MPGMASCKHRRENSLSEATYRTDVRVAEFVAYRDQIERLLPIILSGLFGRPYVGKELNIEVHLLVTQPADILSGQPA